MNLGPFQSIEFEDNDGFDDFKMNLQLNHTRIAQVMFAQGLVYQTYPLIDSVEHNKDWQQNVQKELGSIYALLDLSGLPDLAGSDLSKEEDWDTFFQVLVQVELNINFVLDIH